MSLHTACDKALGELGVPEGAAGELLKVREDLGAEVFGRGAAGDKRGRQSEDERSEVALEHRGELEGGAGGVKHLSRGWMK